jgi:hypothetical protein
MILAAEDPESQLRTGALLRDSGCGPSLGVELVPLGIGDTADFERVLAGLNFS